MQPIQCDPLPRRPPPAGAQQIDEVRLEIGPEVTAEFERVRAQQLPIHGAREPV
jgi:hypothetical protein